MIELFWVCVERSRPSVKSMEKRTAEASKYYFLISFSHSLHRQGYDGLLHWFFFGLGKDRFRYSAACVC